MGDVHSAPANQKKNSKLKALLGGLAAVGIFASFFVLNGQINFFAKNLVAETVASDAPEIVSLDPLSGSVGATVSIVVNNLDNLTRGTGSVSFGDFSTEIEAIDESPDGQLTVFVHVPDVPEVGRYAIRVRTPSEVVTGIDRFEVTKINELAPLPAEEPMTETMGDPVPDTTGELSNETPMTEAENTPPPEFLDTLEKPEDPLPTQTSSIEAPTNLEAVAVAQGIQVSWEGNADTYRIYYGTTSGRYIHGLESQNTVEILNSNFVNGVQYFFTVKTVALDGSESIGSPEVSAIYAPYAPPTSSQLLRANALPPQLSEEGPAETLAVAIFIAFGASFFLFRRKIFVKSAEVRSDSA